MTTERIEVKLRENHGEERELIDALRDQQLQGGKTGLLRDCLLRGYRVVEDRLSDLSVIDDSSTTLKALAELFSSDDHDHHRLVRMYLNARFRSQEEVKKERLSDSVQSEPALDNCTANSDGLVQDVVPSEPQTNVALQTSEPDSSAARRINWKGMRGLAGSISSEDGSE